MKMHPSKIRKATQRELFATEEYGSSRGSWLVLDGQGKPDRRAMTSLHGKCRKDGRRREQKELARYLARGAGTRKGHGFLLSEFEATLELDGPWEATRVILESLHLHPHSHELRYRLHFLHLGEGNLAAAAHWLVQALLVEKVILPKPRPRPVRKVVRPKAVPRLIDRGPPREINYFFYASPFIWGEEEWDEDEYWN